MCYSWHWSGPYSGVAHSCRWAIFLSHYTSVVEEHKRLRAPLARPLLGRFGVGPQFLAAQFRDRRLPFRETFGLEHRVGLVLVVARLLRERIHDVTPIMFDLPVGIGLVLRLDPNLERDPVAPLLRKLLPLRDVARPVHDVNVGVPHDGRDDQRVHLPIPALFRITALPQNPYHDRHH